MYSSSPATATPSMASYPDFPYQSEKDTALEYLRREAFSEDGWTTFDNKQGVEYQKKTIEGDTSAIPIVRGRGLVEGFTPQQFLALITYTGVRTTWDTRTEKAEVVKRFGRYLSEFYAIQRGIGWVVSPRDIVGCQDTIISEDGSIERVQTSVEDSDKPPVYGRVRATLTLAGWVLSPAEQGTNVTYVVKSKLYPQFSSERFIGAHTSSSVNPNGSIPITIINNTVIPEIPGAISRASDVLHDKGYPPYISSSILSLIRREDFDFSTRTFEFDFLGKEGDQFEITFDSKIYSQGVTVQGGGDGVETSTDDNKVTVKVEKEREIAFIKQEAHEKAREIKVKADEEFAIEKARIVRQETNAIDAAFEKKKKQAETSQKMYGTNLIAAQSTLTNKSRLRLLQAREQHLQDLFSEARAGLLKLSEDQGRYAQVLESSILEGLLRFMEPSITVKCRPKDKGLAEKAAEGAKQQYTEISGLKAEVSVEGSLTDDSAGGVKLVAGTDRITMDNTLDERLRLLEDRMLPEIRYDLFGRNENRKFDT
ncbi:V-ATPase V1 sector subunit E [Tulasnella sp. 417]|nr:V-ATPase V1 sector subunit E [Tulasnella sp. 417]